MGNELVDVKVDQQTILTILNRQIQSSIALQLGDSTKIIGEAVAYALSRKVDSNGKVSQYSSDNKYDYLDIVSSNLIQEAAKEALQEWLKSNSAKIKKAVKDELKKPERQETLARAFADTVEESMKCSWIMNCSIDFKKNSD